MGKPAARMGDVTAHGGTVVLGAPNVLIGGAPAARQGDMHVCPMLNPGVPPPPHVGGPIALGSMGVLIAGAPAARVGDMATCSGPPDTIAMGCPTVLIGETGAAGGGGGAGLGQDGSASANAASGKGASASSAGAVLTGDARETDEKDAEKDRYWVEFDFVDAAGKPAGRARFRLQLPDGSVEEGTVPTNGIVLRKGLKGEGTCRIRVFAVFDARWSARKVRLGEKVKLTAQVWGIDDGTPAQLVVYERSPNAAARTLAVIKTAVEGGKIEGEWTYELADEDLLAGPGTPEGYVTGECVFVAEADGARAVSSPLLVRERIEIQLSDENGKPISGKKYVLYLADGSVRTGTLDKDGKATEEDVPPRACKVVFPEIGEVRRLPYEG